MATIAGVRFKPCGKIFNFDCQGIELKIGDYVVAESEFGISIGRVISLTDTNEDVAELKKIIRKTTKEDLQTAESNKLLQEEARGVCLERIKARAMPMKLVTVEATLDRKRVIFYFTADGRIDFRELVKDLASKFKTRIEMRQVGIRDESRMVGGIGICGRELCCSRFLTSFEPVSIKMAKKQELSLNVGKISGLCSRLMCCLRYEYDGSEQIVEDEILPVDNEITETHTYTSEKKISELLSGIERECIDESHPGDSHIDRYETCDKDFEKIMPDKVKGKTIEDIVHSRYCNDVLEEFTKQISYTSLHDVKHHSVDNNTTVAVDDSVDDANKDNLSYDTKKKKFFYKRRRRFKK